MRIEACHKCQQPHARKWTLDGRQRKTTIWVCDACLNSVTLADVLATRPARAEVADPLYRPAPPLKTDARRP